MEETIKLFISYSHDSDEHKSWVLKLATHLRNHGVDVILDQWDLRLGDDLPFFMENGLTSSSLILCVCSENYTNKANIQKGGVGYEKKILTSDLLNDSSLNYIIPIVRNNLSKNRPTFLKSNLYIDFSNDGEYYSKYYELISRIYNEDINKKPILGENPFRKKTITQTITQTISLEKIEFINPIFEGEISFDYTRNNGIFQLGEGEYIFNTMWTGAGNNSIHCYRDHVLRLGYNPTYKDFPEYNEIINFDFSSRARTIKVNEIAILENKNNKFIAIKVLKVFYNNVDSDHNVTFKYKIYNEIS